MNKTLEILLGSPSKCDAPPTSAHGDAQLQPDSLPRNIPKTNAATAQIIPICIFNTTDESTMDLIRGIFIIVGAKATFGLALIPLDNELTKLAALLSRRSQGLYAGMMFVFCFMLGLSPIDGGAHITKHCEADAKRGGILGWMMKRQGWASSVVQSITISEQDLLQSSTTH